MSATCRRRVEMSPILAQHACRVRHKREPDTYVSTLVCCCVVSSPHHVTSSCHVPLHLVAASCLAITSRRCVAYCLVAASRLCLLSHLFCLVDCCVVALNIVGVVSPCESCHCAASRHCVVSLHLVGALYLIFAMSLVSLSLCSQREKRQFTPSGSSLATDKSEFLRWGIGKPQNLYYLMYMFTYGGIHTKRT